MKNRIHILPESIANKIAAGEVVERPAAALKECVENAIDAGASKITIILKQAGKSVIKVIDDGRGMSEFDAELCFARHATSKINTVEDLDKIETMGFRGEALPSIAAVAQVELVTRQADDDLAHFVRIEDSAIIEKGKRAAEFGTSITISNLFFNVPARKNFLKSDATEFSKCVEILKKFFFAFPATHFVFYHNDELVFDLYPASLDKRLSDVLGKSIYTALLSVDEQLMGIRINGFVLKADFARYSKGLQFLYVNQRMVQSKYLHHAVQTAYGHKIESGQHPGYCLFIECNPMEIDINVHPSKMEVRFSNERAIYSLCLSACKKALNVDSAVPELSDTFSNTDYFSSKPQAEISRPISLSQLNYQAPQSFGLGNKKKSLPAPNQARLTFTFKAQEEIIDERLLQRSQDEPVPESVLEENLETDAIKQISLYQIHNRYILSQIQSGLVIIDQHVAHERILYERILSLLQDDKTNYSQQLLFPQTVQLTTEDYSYFMELEDFFKKMGFSVRPFGNKTVAIEAIPLDVKVGHESKAFLDILDYHKENISSDKNPAEKMAAAFACKNAIKSGEILSQSEMQAMLDQLFATSQPYYCPHGRPVIVTMSLQELDKKFKRI